MIKLHDIHLSFNDKDLFSGFSMEVKKGEKICLWGASGSGKTSLLKCISGFINPQGSIQVNNLTMSLETVNEIRKQIAWLPQNINLPVKNGAELFTLLFQKVPESTQHHLSRLGLTPEFLTKDLSTVSGGEKQRIILTACLMLERPILLLDEPTSALDKLSIDKMSEIIFSNPELTVVSSSHNSEWAEQCDRIVKINEGVE